MNRELAIVYEVFEEEGEALLSVLDIEKDKVINMFRGKAAEKIYRLLSREESDKLFLSNSKKDAVIRAEMEKCIEEIIEKMNLMLKTESLTKEYIKKTFNEIRELVHYMEMLALEKGKCK